MKFNEQVEVRIKLEEMGVDKEILQHIDKMPREEQSGIYLFFLEIISDELLFVISLKDNIFTKNYLAKKSMSQPLGLN